MSDKYHTRNQNGIVKYYDNIDEAMKDFLSYEGYRLGIDMGDNVIYIFREELPEMPKGEPGSLSYSDPTRRIVYNSKITVLKN